MPAKKPTKKSKSKSKPKTKPATRTRAKQAAAKAKKPLELELASGKTIPAVKPAQIAAAIADEEFGILRVSARSNTYIQFADQDEAPYEHILEYQEGSTANHYAAVHPGIPIAAIADVFAKYLRGDPAWKTAFEWEKMELG
jgi:hypothetical protein